MVPNARSSNLDPPHAPMNLRRHMWRDAIVIYANPRAEFLKMQCKKIFLKKKIKRREKMAKSWLSTNIPWVCWMVHMLCIVGDLMRQKHWNSVKRSDKSLIKAMCDGAVPCAPRDPCINVRSWVAPNFQETRPTSMLSKTMLENCWKFLWVFVLVELSSFCGMRKISYKPSTVQ